MQLYLSTNGIFMNGAIANGLHYENERMIFSEGLINAYEMRDKSRLPRILISQNLCDRMKRESCPDYGSQLSSYLIMSPDGLQFLDYLQLLSDEQGLNGEMDDFFENHKRAIVQQVQRNLGHHRIIMKYKWLADYHNFEFNEFYDPEDYVDGYFNLLGKTLLIPLDIFPDFKKPESSFRKERLEQVNRYKYK